MRPLYLINGDDHIMPCNREMLVTYNKVTADLGFKVNQEKSILSRSWLCLNSTLIKRTGKQIFYTNLAYLQKDKQFDCTSITACWNDLLKTTNTDKNKLKSLFVRNRATDLKVASWDGLLNHQLLSEEGGLGILTNSERENPRNESGRLKVTNR